MSFHHKRMADYLKPDDLNLDSCINLASAVLHEAAEAYLEAARALKRYPDSKDARSHYERCRAFYSSDYYKILSCGVVSGADALRSLDAMV